MDYLQQLLNNQPVEWKKLGEVAQYSKTRIDASLLNENNYVGVDNMLQNCKGKTFSEHVPTTGRFTAYAPKNILIGNIRPYLKKIWFADNEGGTNGDVLVIQTTDERVLPEYLYQVLSDDAFFSYDMQHAKGAKMPRGNKDKILDYIIPIPPLSVQSRIVEILDKFTAMEAELQAELELRKKQYIYYRELLLLKNPLCKPVPLGWLGEVRMCKRILKNQTTEEGDIPFYKIGTFGKQADAYISRPLYEEFRSKYPYPSKGDMPISASGTIGRVIEFDGEDAYFQDSNIVWLEHDGTRVINRYLYHCYQIADWKVAKGGTITRLYNDNFKKTEIPIPPLSEQARIVEILDKFDTLTNSISEGLPLEIQLRRQQYEYYREQLLDFRN